MCYGCVYVWGVRACGVIYVWGMRVCGVIYVGGMRVCGVIYVGGGCVCVWCDACVSEKECLSSYTELKCCCRMHKYK